MSGKKEQRRLVPTMAYPLPSIHLSNEKPANATAWFVKFERRMAVTRTELEKGNAGCQQDSLPQRKLLWDIVEKKNCGDGSLSSFVV